MRANRTDGNGRDISSRVVRLESTYESLVKGQAALETEMHELAARMDRGLSRISEEIQARSRPQWSLLIATATFAMSLITLAAGAGLAYTNLSISKVSAATEQRFNEVETQFRGVNKEIQTQIDHNTSGSNRNVSEIDKLRERINKLEDSTVDSKARLDSHDRYLWPQIQHWIEH